MNVKNSHLLTRKTHPRLGHYHQLLAGLASGVLLLGMANMARATEIAHWGFDETGGSTAFDSVGGVNGTLIGGAAFTTTGGVKGGSVQVTNGYVNMGNNFSLTPTFSVSVWVNTLDNTGAPVSKHWMGWANGWFFGLGQVTSDTYPNSTSLFVGGLNSVTAVGTPAINDGQWHQLVGSYKNDTMNLYIDGNLSGVGYTPSGYQKSDVNLMIGATTDFNGITPVKSFHGFVDEFSIYDNALSGNDVKALYNSTLYVPTMIDGSTLAPGGVDAIGQSTIAGDATFRNGSQFVVDFDLAGLKNDYLGIGGKLNLGGDTVLDLNFINDLMLGVGKEFKLVGFGGWDGNYFKGFANGYQFKDGLNRWEIDYRADGIYLTSLGAAAVPEPSSVALMGLGLGVWPARSAEA